MRSSHKNSVHRFIIFPRQSVSSFLKNVSGASLYSISKKCFLFFFLRETLDYVVAALHKRIDLHLRIMKVFHVHEQYIENVLNRLWCDILNVT